MKNVWSVALLLLFVFFMTACTDESALVDDNDNNNAPEVNEEVNNETNAEGNSEDSDEADEPENDIAESDNEQESLHASSMTTLQLTERITEEWKNTGHASVDNALAYAGMRDGCQPCHSGNGFDAHMSDEPFTPESQEEEGAIDDAPRTMDCATCHSGAGREMLETGITEGYVPFVDGEFDAGRHTALCISCHNGRRDTNDMFAQWESGEGQPADYPHYDAGALYSGKGGMEYPDVEYANSGGHQNRGCTGCHMPETEQGYVSHTFAMEVELIDVTCHMCHDGAEDFTIGSDLQAELDELLEELHEAAVGAVDGAAAIGLERMTFPFEDENGEPVDIENVSLEAFVAAYNYYLIYADKSGGVHNPQYARSLLEESLNRLK